MPYGAKCCIRDLVSLVLLDLLWGLSRAAMGTGFRALGCAGMDGLCAYGLGRVVQSANGNQQDHAVPDIRLDLESHHGLVSPHRGLARWTLEVCACGRSLRRLFTGIPEELLRLGYWRRLWRLKHLVAYFQEAVSLVRIASAIARQVAQLR